MQEFVKLQRRETVCGDGEEGGEVRGCGWCEAECDPATAVLPTTNTSGTTSNTFCSDQCFAQYRRKVYRLEQDQSPVNLSVSAGLSPPKPRLSVKPDHLLKMSSREKQR